MRFSRLKCLKSRDDCMQAVLAEAASKLPSLISGPGYASLLESLILEALISLLTPRWSSRAVAGQEGATKKVSCRRPQCSFRCAPAPRLFRASSSAILRRHPPSLLPPPPRAHLGNFSPVCLRPPPQALDAALPKYKAWATKEMGAEWAAGITVTLDSQSLKTGIGGVELVGFGGKITLTNTLQSRLMLAYETQLPKLRKALFTSI